MVRFPQSDLYRDILGVRKVASILVKTTPSDAPLAVERITPEVVIHVPDGYFTNQKVLLVDAVMESGTTAELCIAALERGDTSDIKVAMMVDWYNSDLQDRIGQTPTH